MLKAIERLHVRSDLIQIGCSCMGQQLVGCYRTLKDDETGCTVCMMMFWNGTNGERIDFRVQESDELMHLRFEDHGCDWDRENELKANGDIKPEDRITRSPAYERVAKQLLNAMTKKLNELGYEVHDDLVVLRK